MFVVLLGQPAYAAQIASRSIKLSTSNPGASGVTYTLTFTPQATEQELIVDFCGDTPIVGATCAFSNATTPVVSSATSSAGTISYPGSNGHTLRVTSLTMTASSPYTITFSNITNPTTAAGTIFYARVLTFSTGNSSGYTPAAATGGSPAVGSYVDYGGVALSVAQQISISATVMETLTFCTSGSTITGTCGSTTTPSFTIGHGTPPTISASAVDAVVAYTQLSTNAGTGATVRMKASNSCANGGLSANGGSTCNIAGVGGTAATIAAGAAQVGMCVAPGGGVSVAGTYNDSINSCPTTYNASSKYGMNGGNLTSTYGDTIYTTAGAVTAITSTCTFVATAGVTTPAGIYAGNESLIATGVY